MICTTNDIIYSFTNLIHYFISIEDLPIFGVPLSVAVERSKCHDGVDIPLIVRNCIDHVQETGGFCFHSCEAYILL